MTNNFLWNEKLVKKITNGETYGKWEANKICIDTRKITKGDIFVAFKGVNVDGHDYLKEAFDKGAHAAFVEYIPKNIEKHKSKLVVVKNTTQAITDIAIFNRKRTKAKIIAVTGSIGKTSTKEALYAAFSSISNAYCSQGNYNNNLGLPISLASMPLDTKYGIYELGMNHAGEMAELTKFLKPDIAIITTIAPVHLEYFNSLADIAKAKAEIFLGMNSKGLVLLNGEGEGHNLLLECAKARGIKNIFSFGKGENNDGYMIELKRKNDHTFIKASIMGQEIQYKIKAYGEHQALNTITALLAVKTLGLDMEKSALGLKKFSNIKGRGKIDIINFNGKKIILIDDSYNANPDSIRAALAALKYIDDITSKRKIAILADMYELGENQIDMHKELLPDIEISGVNKIITVGSLMKNLFDSMPEDLKLAHFKNSASIIADIDKLIENQDCILVKGSFGTKIYELVNYLEGNK
jgi:UDP-N-acetylmuramoyl-tripeptide--D-alanyl-D-alanine ligase